jgi:hypothetical protein
VSSKSSRHSTKKENKVKGLKGDTLKVYCAIAAFYKSTVVQMVRCSFMRAGFRLDAVHPERVPDRISISEIALEKYVTPETLRPSLSTDQPARRRHEVPAPGEFAVSLQVYIKQVSGICPSVVMQRKKTHLMRKKLGLIKSYTLPPPIFRNYRLYFELIVFLLISLFSYTPLNTNGTYSSNYE